MTDLLNQSRTLALPAPLHPEPHLVLPGMVKRVGAVPDDGVALVAYTFDMLDELPRVDDRDGAMDHDVLSIFSSCTGDFSEHSFTSDTL